MTAGSQWWFGLGVFFWSGEWFTSGGAVLKLKRVFGPYYTSWYLQRRMFSECLNKRRGLCRGCAKALVNSLLGEDFAFITGNLRVQRVERARFFFL